MQPAMDTTADYDNPDEWELVNDNGFVYKRKWRQCLDPAATSSSAPPPPDPALERKHRRERKKKALLKLRDRYSSEIRQWELLSNTLKEMENSNNQTQPMEREEPCPTTSYGGPSSSGEHSAPNSTCRRLVYDLLCQVEAQEAVIRNVSNLCDVAEALCSAQEERLKQQFTDLPIWEPSPNELMTALCER